MSDATPEVPRPALVDACFFINFACTGCLHLFDALLPGGASTGYQVHEELQVKHSGDTPGRLDVLSADASELAPLVLKVRSDDPRLSDADAELIALAQLAGGTVYSDERAVYETCGLMRIGCRRTLGVLSDAVQLGVITPNDAIGMVRGFQQVMPPRRIPKALVDAAIAQWTAMLTPPYS